ncbi:major capsid protein [Streptococcus phage C1]|uniref:Major capsid protein n=1 Tax=Streptococcus phage C1 TaxID=2907838 RepID=Q7Y3E6_BPSC1|nr:major head protein [Streptococcus phage C1]AAP42315.1 major capsid protein [Streptococcus phage C1]
MADETTNVAGAIVASLNDFNADNGKSWTFGTNWNAVGTDFETYTNQYLFPKLNETLIVETAAGNRLDWLAKEIDFIGQYSEEYVILDTVPVELDLSKSAQLMLERNYPKIASKLYGAGILKKLKFTLNDNIQRQQFATLGDATKFAVQVYKKKIADINISEEQELKAIIMDYTSHIADVREVESGATMQQFINKVYTAILNLQNNSAKHNEAAQASGGAVGRFTTNTKLKDMLIVTTDEMKVEILNSFLANTFHAEGLDITSQIISFEDLGGVYKAAEDITVDATIQGVMAAMGDYQVKAGDVIPAGTVFTYEIPAEALGDQADALVEVKPDSDEFVAIFDVRSIRYKRYTRNMLKAPFYNGEFDEVTHWIHYYSMKAISPFYNKVVIKRAN